MQFESLKQNIIDAVEEGQIKLGFRSEILRLYYPLSSLCAFTGENANAEKMEKALQNFASSCKEDLGMLEISRKGDRFCIAVPPEGVTWIYEHTPRDGFLASFIHTIARHGCTLEDLLACFRKVSDHVHAEELHNGEFDWLIYFEDGKPDSFRYCITDEGCHMTYHRFTKVDYEAFGF